MKNEGPTHPYWPHNSEEVGSKTPAVTILSSWQAAKADWRPRICTLCCTFHLGLVANRWRSLALLKTPPQKNETNIAKHRNKHEGSGKKQIYSISPKNSFLALPLSLNISSFPSFILLLKSWLTNLVCKVRHMCKASLLIKNQRNADERMCFNNWKNASYWARWPGRLPPKPSDTV